MSVNPKKHDNLQNSQPSAKRSSEWFKSILSQPKLIINTAQLLVFCSIWISEFLYWFPKDAFGRSFNYWTYTDWLIDYSQGFIRRGFSGLFWGLLPKGTDLLVVVAAFSWILILLVVAGYVRLLARNLKAYPPLTLFGLLFLPSLFFFYLHDHNGIGRKEVLGYISLLLHLLIIERVFPVKHMGQDIGKAIRRYVVWLLPLTVVFLPMIVLVHEGNFLLFIPIHGLLTLTILRLDRSRGWLKSFLLGGLMYLPALAAVGAVYLSGTPQYDTLFRICLKWLGEGALRETSCILPPDALNGSTLPGALIPMDWSLGQAISITNWIVMHNLVTLILIMGVLAGCTWYLARQGAFAVLRARCGKPFSNKEGARYLGRFFGRFFLIPLLFAVPVFVTAYDYGRWITVLCVNFMLVAVSANLPVWEFEGGLAAAEGKAGDDEPKGYLDKPWVFYGVSIVICLATLVLMVPHFCLFSCEVVRSPLEFLSHSFTPR